MPFADGLEIVKPEKIAVGREHDGRPGCRLQHRQAAPGRGRGKRDRSQERNVDRVQNARALAQNRLAGAHRNLSGGAGEHAVGVDEDDVVVCGLGLGDRLEGAVDRAVAAGRRRAVDMRERVRGSGLRIDRDDIRIETRANRREYGVVTRHMFAEAVRRRRLGQVRSTQGGQRSRRARKRPACCRSCRW